MKNIKRIAAVTAVMTGLTLGFAGPADAKRDTGWPCPGCKVASNK